MPGGLLNIIAFGNSNIILNGNPTKTFFKTVYAKYTNFGMQKFRLDYTGTRQLNPTTDSTFTFKVPRQGDLLMDSYFVFSLPNIWSTILPPSMVDDFWKAYQFKWIENIGTSIIKNIRIMIGTQLIQEYNGEYIRCMAERDFDESKKHVFNNMTGNTTELHHPEYYGGNRDNSYPNAFFSSNITGQEPSIRGRKIYVPLCPWFMNNSKLALPMVCLQYSEVTIEVTLRPIKEIFTINNVNSESTDITNVDNANRIYQTLLNQFYKRIQPNFTIERHSLYRFLQPPPSIQLQQEDYKDTTVNWDADVHIIANYAFLTPEENKIFALNEQKYLIKDVKTTLYSKISGTKKIKVESNSLVSNWMWFYRRSDVYERNEWSNYTNWETTFIPYNLIKGLNETPYDLNYGNVPCLIGPGRDIVTNGTTYGIRKIPTNHRITPDYSLQNTKYILDTFSITIDGKIRETELDEGVFRYIEKYRGTHSSNDFGLYHYNFCLDTTNYIQPSGAMNLHRFKNIEFEMTTLEPTVDPSSETLVLCDDDGGVIGISKETSIYLYTYDMYLFEEHYNVLRFISGNAGLLFTR